MQTLPILTANNRLCTKQFIQKSDTLAELNQAMPYLFDHKAVEIDSLLTLSEQLKQLEELPNCLVIRGQLIEGRPSQSIRRTLRVNQGKEPNFEPCYQQWCLIDIDNLPLPDHLNDYQNSKVEIVDLVVSHLPKQFQNVQCWYQFSSSMGIKQDKVRLHLWYWLSRPCTDEEMKGWKDEMMKG